MPLRKIRSRPSAHQACEDELRRAIVDRELAPGERLPPERELAVTLGVSRLTLRAALAALTARGLLAVKHGSGYIVQDYVRHGGADLLSDLALDTAPVADELLRVRRHLAAALLEHFVEKPPRPAAIAAFDAAVEAMATVVRDGGSLEQLALADLDVVRALVNAAGSTVLMLCFNPVVKVLASSSALRGAIYGDGATNVMAWRALGVWLRDPNPHGVAAILRVAEGHDRASVERLRRRRAR